jgi:hypothetical protein
LFADAFLISVPLAEAFVRGLTPHETNSALGETAVREELRSLTI